MSRHNEVRVARVDGEIPHDLQALEAVDLQDACERGSSAEDSFSRLQGGSIDP
jgi:hypothetical protein